MKKVVSLLLAVVFVLGMSTVALSADKITGLNDSFPGVAFIDLLPETEVNPGMEEVDLFQINRGAWLVNDVAPADPSTITKNMVEKIDVGFRSKKNGSVIDEVKADVNDSGQLIVTAVFTDPWPSVNDIDFTIDVHLIIDGKRSDQKWDWYYEYSGNMSNEVTELEDDEDYVDCSDGQVASALQYLRNITVDGGNGVEAVINMANKKKIYFRAMTDFDPGDDAVVNRYPSIEMVYNIKQVGMSSYSGNIITLGDVDPAAYIYTTGEEGALKYLGRGGDKLPYADKYFVSNAKIEIEEPVEPVDSGEVPTPPANENGNPPTGR